MLEIKGVEKTYATDRLQTRALRGVNLNVAEGEYVAITGPSGSGKSTLLSVLGLLESPTAGSYYLDGQSVERLSDNTRSRVRREKIGFIFQAFNLLPELDVFSNVELPLRYRGINSGERRRSVALALERMGLQSRAHHLPSQLSGGQQQRVAIARAIAGRPRIVLADEPTGNLDSEMAAEISSVLKDLNVEGTTIVMVTHDLSLAGSATRVVQMLDGRLASVGMPVPECA